MNHAKTFRLFISSTFSDFKKEREVLQADVFPVIKEYALSKGYTFQPIDLRWGVSEEAQLDQKTIELCLNEVRNCKSYPYPNFLLMLGDRYGWVPLPYAIEENEFNSLKDNILLDEEVMIEYKGSLDVKKWKILKRFIEIYDNYTIVTFKENGNGKIDFHLLKKTNKKKLLCWYQLDKNQLPASYILKPRKNEYKVYDIWVEEENTVRKLLQETAKNVFGEKSKEYKKLNFRT